jgi:hypothetical protein
VNEPDLKFLAARASALEDRTTERLGNVHSRIDQARRQRRAGSAIGVACLVVALVAGLMLVQNNQAKKTPSPAPTPAPRAAPAVGTCWTTPGATDDTDLDPANWYLDSPEVPCTEPHNAETVTVFHLGDPTPEFAAKLMDDCEHAVAIYLGIDEAHWIPWNAGMSLPTREQIAQGAHWAQCVAVIPTAMDGGPDWQTLTESVEGVATDPPVEYLACTDDPPTSYDQHRVPCDAPHTYEQTGGIVLIDDAVTYPSAVERTHVVNRDCPATLPAASDGLSTTALWDRRSWHSRGEPVGAVCFMYNSDGTPLPGR